MEVDHNAAELSPACEAIPTEVFKAAVLVDAAMSYSRWHHLQFIMEYVPTAGDREDIRLRRHLDRRLYSTSRRWKNIIYAVLVCHLALGLFEFDDPVGWRFPFQVTSLLEIGCLGVYWYDLYCATMVDWFVDHNRNDMASMCTGYWRHLRDGSTWDPARLVLLIVSSLTTALSVVWGGEFKFISQLCRPVFAVHRVRSVRKIANSILKSLPDILFILTLLFCAIFIFAYLGWLLFQDVPNDEYFSDLSTSVVSMIVLVTTANYPDVSLPAVDFNRWNALFFVGFLLVALFLLMNLVLAVVYDTYDSQVADDVVRYSNRNRVALTGAYDMLRSLFPPPAADDVASKEENWDSSFVFCNPWTELLTLLVRQRCPLIGKRHWSSDQNKVQILFRAMDQDHDMDISYDEFTSICVYAMADFVITTDALSGAFSPAAAFAADSMSDPLLLASK